LVSTSGSGGDSSKAKVIDSEILAKAFKTAMIGEGNKHEWQISVTDGVRMFV